MTPTENEAQITFGRTKILFLTDIYNTRVSFTSIPILLGTADIKACFRYACIHADLTEAFGFAAGGYYNLATAMVFGSTISASSWEVYRRAIEGMSKEFANSPDSVIKHCCYLDMIWWAEIDPNAKITLAVACAILGGLPTKAKGEIRLKACIFVDDSLTLALHRSHMEMVLAALI